MSEEVAQLAAIMDVRGICICEVFGLCETHLAKRRHKVADEVLLALEEVLRNTH